MQKRARNAPRRAALLLLSTPPPSSKPKTAPQPKNQTTGFQYPHDAFRETHELMDSLIASYQAGCKDDTDAVREAARMVEDAIAAAAAREGAAAAAVRGAFDYCLWFLFT